MDRNEYCIIYPHCLPFFSMKQRPQHLCIELAKLGYKVVFCDALYIENGRTVEYETYPSSGGSLHICYNIKNYARSTDLIKNRHICFFSSSKTAHTGNEIKSMINIWDYLDDFHINRLHDASALLAANAVVTTAKSLYETAISHFQRGPVRLIENACPENLVEHFKPLTYAKGVGKLKIYYIGAIAPWIMWDELLKFAKDNESILDLYLVGRRFLRGNEFKGVAFDYVLKDYPNVHEVGHVSSDGLLDCFVDADAFILPFIPPHKTDSQEMIDLMTATNPIKFWEYLATGKPIITSRLPEVIRITDNANGAKFPGVHFADTAEEMSAALCLFNYKYISYEDMHIAMAAQNTWRHRAAELDKLIFELIEAGVDNQAGKQVQQVL